MISKPAVRSYGLILSIGLGILLLLGCSKEKGADTPKPATPVTVSSVSLSQDTAEMATGEQLTLYATVLPKEASQTATIIWASSNNSVATVNSQGVVTGVSSGTSTITASCEGKSAKCFVSVQGLSGSSEGTGADVWR